MASDSESAEESNVFYFESDHLALRGNRDYTNMLRTIAVLEAQKIRVQQQIEELALAKKRYLEEPELFLAKIRNNEEIISPNYMTIANVSFEYFKKKILSKLNFIFFLDTRNRSL